MREVFLDDEGREATVVVPDDQLALAIGKEGLNARLAARLTGWRIDIQSDTEFAQAEAAAAYAGGGGEDDDWSGRCAAILSNGKRCPNTALPGTRYCGVPGHQALAAKEAELPAEAPETTEPATAEEATELEPVGRIEEPGGDAAPIASDETPDPVNTDDGSPVAARPEVAPPAQVPAGIPIEVVPEDEAERRVGGDAA